MLALVRLERDFLPPFNEGAVQVNVLLPPGTSLATLQRRRRARSKTDCSKLDDITAFVRTTGRAELDEHAEGVNITRDHRHDRSRHRRARAKK